MVNGQNMDPNEMHLVSYSMKSDVEARKRPTSHTDIVALRIKNRERQRRYRARKRLEADMNNSPIITLPNQHNAEVGQIGNVPNVARRVFCKRDWKKDARRVRNQVPGMVDSIIPEKSSLETSQEVCEKRKFVLDRRDWKAEARNKKSKGDLV